MNEEEIARLANKFCESKDVSATEMELILNLITYLVENGYKQQQPKTE